MVGDRQARELDDHLVAVSRAVHRGFEGVFAPETIDRYLGASMEAFRGATVRIFVPVMVERFTTERLQALAQAEARVTKAKPEVLFVCVHNAGRSQMAAALLDHWAKGRVHVRSAGSEPADRINPAVVEALAEVGVDVTKEFPKPLTDEVVRAADVVITMGCGDACPVYPGARYVDWDLDDPAGQSLAQVQRIRDEIDRRVRALLDELVGGPA
jgi:protein-tyrosine-phosphatase